MNEQREPNFWPPEPEFDEKASLGRARELGSKLAEATISPLVSRIAELEGENRDLRHRLDKIFEHHGSLEAQLATATAENKRLGELLVPVDRRELGDLRGKLHKAEADAAGMAKTLKRISELAPCRELDEHDASVAVNMAKKALSKPTGKALLDRLEAATQFIKHLREAFALAQDDDEFQNAYTELLETYDRTVAEPMEGEK